MKTYYCYTLRKINGEIVYTGMTENPKKRLYNHIHAKPGNGTGMGMFYGQKLWMHIEKEFTDKSIAQWYEGYLKYKLGFNDEIITDNQIKGKIGGKIGSKIGASEVNSIPIIAYTKSSQFVKEFKSQHEASRELNCDVCNINHVLKGRQKSTGGYIFKYK